MEKRAVILYPVACFITGTTPNGGGIWKYVLHGLPQGLLRRNLPVLTQALHFLDFSVSPSILGERWRRPLRESYNGRFGLHYYAPLFLDSGGFTLMFDPDLDLTKYGIAREQLAEGILRLQMDLGAKYVASLDYPLPPGLDSEEAERRMHATLDNALRVARELRALPDDTRPRLYVPIHGPTPELMGTFVRQLIDAFQREDLMSVVEGLAVGSMVPLRRSHRVAEIVQYVRQARAVMPADMPLHVFGVTGMLTPFLMAEGATSFDTCAYVQNAKALKYLDPSTYQSHHFHELSSYHCNCVVCKDRDLSADKALLKEEKRGRKSEVYGAIALHNLEIDLQLVARAQQAQDSNRLEEFMAEMAGRHKGAAKLLAATRQPIQRTLQIPVMRTITKHAPEDFDIDTRNYHPAAEKSICLILPCSQEKPYTSSQSFQFVWRHLEEALEDRLLRSIQVVFLSGLYGPVPQECATEEAVTTYDFLLHPRDTQGISRVSSRLARFLSLHSSHFRSIFAYVTLPAYRNAVKQVIDGHNGLELLPTSGRQDRFAFYKRPNINELLRQLSCCDRDCDRSLDSKVPAGDPHDSTN